MNRIVQARRLTRLKYGAAMPTDERTAGPVPVMSSGGVTGSHDLANTLGPVIVVGRKGSFGSVHWSAKPAFVIDTAYFSDRSCTTNNLRWLYYVLTAADLRSLTQDVGVPGLSRDSAYAVMVTQPPTVDQQRRIAAFLDDQVARIDRAIALRERQITLAAERNRAAHDHFEVETADAPAMPLVHLTRRSRPINYGVLMPGPHFPGGIPLIEAGDVMRGSLNVSELRRADPEIEREYVRSRLLAGDLVMAIRGSFGAVEICPPLFEIVNVTRDAARISLDQTVVHPPYVRAVLTSSRTKSWFASRILGSAVKGTNIGDLRRVLIPVPDISVQRALAERATEFELEADRHLSLMNESISLLQERKRSLITAAVTGEFDLSSASTRALAGVTS